MLLKPHTLSCCCATMEVGYQVQTVDASACHQVDAPVMTDSVTAMTTLFFHDHRLNGRSDLGNKTSQGPGKSALQKNTQDALCRHTLVLQSNKILAAGVHSTICQQQRLQQDHAHTVSGCCHHTLRIKAEHNILGTNHPHSLFGELPPHTILKKR